MTGGHRKRSKIVRGASFIKMTVPLHKANKENVHSQIDGRRLGDGQKRRFDLAPSLVSDTTGMLYNSRVKKPPTQDLTSKEYSAL